MTYLEPFPAFLETDYGHVCESVENVKHPSDILDEQANK